MIARCGWLIALTFAYSASAQQQTLTGPETEKRFPPLKLADGFEAKLFACDPLVEYPSVIALGSRPGTLFVAQDYLTGLGKEIVKHDEIRLIEDTDGDGYADKTTLVAEGFNSIQGLAYDIGDGSIFVMHAPYLSVVRDITGDDVADIRIDLVEGLGLPPEENDTRLHAANGVTIGHDGWLYLALGDHGARVKRPEGDDLVLVGGGILRCRLDGTDLHIFSTGLRNIYEVALDADLNVFVRDNENDGGDYKIRVYHSFFGADHGYPYKYLERPEETMPPLADLDLGSSAGGVCYLETAFPEKYRGNLFFCDWNHSLVRYDVNPKGASFEPMEEFKVAEGGDGDRYPFKPSDVIVDWDGSLLVSDWADGQRPKRGRARIYRITHRDGKHEVAADPTEDLGKKSLDELIAQMDSESYYARVLAQKEIERRGEAFIQTRLNAFDRIFLTDEFSRPERTVLEVLAISSDQEKPAELISMFPELLQESGMGESRSALFEDSALQHATMQALRRSGNWTAVLRFLNLPDDHPLRPIALMAIGDQFDIEVADNLLNRVKTGRSEYVDLLARIHRKPGPHQYWGYRPDPRPPNTVNWERTEAIEQALDRILEFKRDTKIRRFTLQRMQREKIPVRTETLAKWLETERDAKSVALILQSLREKKKAPELSAVLETIVLGKDHAESNRLTALELIADPPKLTAMADSFEDGPVLAALIERAGSDPKIDIKPLLFKKTESADAGVRAAAIAALGERKISKAEATVLELLTDPEAIVREASARAAERIPLRAAAPQLNALAVTDPAATVRSACYDALRKIGDGRATDSARRDLKTPETQLAALRYLAAHGHAGTAEAAVDATISNRSNEMLAAATAALVKWNRNDQMARLQGKTGMLLRWHVSPPIGIASAGKLPEKIRAESRLPLDWKHAKSSPPHAVVNLPAIETEALRFLVSDVENPGDSETPVQFLAGSNGPFQLWLNGNAIFDHEDSGAFQPDAHRINAVLKPGTNRIAVELYGSAFQLRFRKRSSVAAREELTQAALTASGNIERGRKLFFNLERSQCLACHRLGDQGGKIGPELTGMGGRFSKIYLIESILDPNANVTPGFKTLSLKKKDGTAMLGVKVSESDNAIVIGDPAGQQQEVSKSEIAEIQTPNISLMPAGLENLYTRQEFLDLIAFLVSER